MVTVSAIQKKGGAWHWVFIGPDGDRLCISAISRESKDRALRLGRAALELVRAR